MEHFSLEPVTSLCGGLLDISSDSLTVTVLFSFAILNLVVTLLRPVFPIHVHFTCFRITVLLFFEAKATALFQRNTSRT